jgi:hypothetical protein
MGVDSIAPGRKPEGLCIGMNRESKTASYD